MADIITWGILGIAGMGTLFSAGWLWGYFKNQEAKQRARDEAERERLRADAKAKEAEIYAKPRGDKRSVVDRL